MVNQKIDRTTNSQLNSESIELNRRPLIIAGIVLGIGQGGFFDGIVLHQILQWHHMFTNIETSKTIAGLEINTFGDGLFHAFDWLMTTIGIFLLWCAGNISNVPRSNQTLIGSLFIGAGAFNIVEGIIDHHLLKIHHVKPGINELAWDLCFLAIGLLSLGIGWLLLQRDRLKNFT
jgi:uncharacterized membrane protein